MKQLALVVAAVGVAACADSTAPPPSPVASAAVNAPAAAGTPIPGQYIVRFNDAVRDVPGLARQLATANGGTVRFTYTHAIKGFAGHFSEQAAAALLHNPNVAAVEADQVMQAVGAGGIEAPTPSWGLDRVDQRALPLDNSYTYPVNGSSVTAYIIDTGINPTLADFGGRATIGVDEIGDGQNGVDCNGHGTHVAGTVGGAQYGIAKGVSLVAVRVLDCSGSGSTSGVIAGVDWVTANHAPNSVANMSLGGSLSSTLDASVRNAIASGVTFAIAAGNGNVFGIAQNACNSSPADVAEAITVSATDNTDTKASWANYGTCVDIFAPGVNITSDWYNGSFTNTISGTSMATPHVTGAAALYLDANPGATPAAVASALTSNATSGVVKSAGTGSPNKLLYVSFIAGGGGTTNTPPTASFTSSCTGLACSFADKSTDADGSVTAWSWNFGDGATSPAQNPSHTYASGGSYTVTLTVTDNGGATNTTSQSVAVTAPSGTITLSATGGKNKGAEYADLSWSGASGSVDVWRNSTKVATTSSTATSYHDNIGAKGAGTYQYQVCPTGTARGSSGCSNVATVTF